MMSAPRVLIAAIRTHTLEYGYTFYSPRRYLTFGNSPLLLSPLLRSVVSDGRVQPVQPVRRVFSIVDRQEDPKRQSGLWLCR